MSKMKKLSRRQFLHLAVGTTAGAVLAACQPVVVQQQEAGAPAPPGPETVELTWLVRSHPVENPWEEEVVIPRYKELEPDVDVSLVVTVGGEWNAKVMSMYAADTPPDVHNGIVGTFIQLYAQDKVLELTPLIERDNFDLEPFGPLAKDPDMCRSGKQWALPILSTYGTVLFYNMDLFDEAGLDYPPTDWQDKGWNWDKVVELGTKLTKNYGTGDAVYGFIGGDQFHQWAYVWGGDCWTEEWYAQGIAEAGFVASQEVIDGVAFKQDLIHKHKISPTPSDAAALNQLGNPFQTGRLAMEWTGGWGYWNYADITAFRWGVAPTPWGASNKAVNWTDAVLAPKEGVDPEKSWALIKYLTSQEGQITYATATGTPPTRVDAIDPWLDFLAPRTGMESRETLKEVALGYRDSYQDNWAHYVINAREYQNIQTQEFDVILSGEKTAAEHMPEVERLMNEASLKAYEEFKDTRLTSDTLCQPLST